MLSIDRFTIKAREIVKSAFDFARDLAHQQIEPEYFLLALVSTPDKMFQRSEDYAKQFQDE